MPGQGSTDAGQTRTRRQWTRAESTLLVCDFEEACAANVSQRRFAREHSVPLGTLQYWLERKEGLDGAPELVAFLESPVGLAFLHRVVMAAMFQFAQVGSCGVDQVGAFIKLAGLAPFVAASHGTLQGVAGEMESQIVAYGVAERQKLAGGMARRPIVGCADETFHPEVCLVAIEPASDFIVMERYAHNREAATWTAAMAEAVADLPVDIVAVASDQGKGLVAHIKKGLGAHAAPDVFHVTHDLWKGLGRPLAASLSAPTQALEAARSTLARRLQNKADYWADWRRPGRPPAFDKYIAAAGVGVQAAQVALQAAVGRADRTEAAIRAVSHAYHPVDLQTGRLRHEKQVSDDLMSAFKTMDEAADAIHLGADRRSLIDKARRVVPKMVATIAFWHVYVAQLLNAFAADDAVREHIRTRLIPAFYILKVAPQAATAADRERLRATGHRLLLLARADLDDLSEDLAAAAERLASDCANLFVRATSCVEGRNGQLALRHHSFHRLSHSHLAVLTIIHNFHIRRPDGTTPAERFFGAPHDALFEWLLDHLDLPARPRSRTRARAA